MNIKMYRANDLILNALNTTNQLSTNQQLFGLNYYDYFFSSKIAIYLNILKTNI